MLQYVQKNTRHYRKSLVPSYCEIPDCNYSRFVTRHRIKQGKEGGKYIAGNVIGLCPNHHAEADAGLIPKFILFGIVHARLREEENGST